MARLFPDSVPLEDLFTEAIVRLFETRPELCISWLKEADLLSTDPTTELDERYARVKSQRLLDSLGHHDSASRPDLLIEIHRSSGEDSKVSGSVAEVVMVESKIGSKEGPEQLRRYAEHLAQMPSVNGNFLLYVTRDYDPKDPAEILYSLDDEVSFKQLRWHDFYRFLQKVEKDALVEEVMAFMEEQGMARTYRFSTADLMALSGVPRSFELLDETLGGEVKAELESFAGNKIKREGHALWEIRTHRRYYTWATLHGRDLFCGVGYQLSKVEQSAHASILRIPADGYPAIFAFLEAQPGAVGREASVAAMKKIALDEDWELYNADNPTGWVGVRRIRNLATLLSEEDHVAAVKSFFVESIRQLREELTTLKKEHPDLPWAGG
jgi:hypothetical protein